MTMDLRNPDVWLSHLLKDLPEAKLAAAAADNNTDWEFIDSEIVKLGSLTHSQLDVPEIQRRGLRLLATESKDFRLLAHLLRTLQHAGDMQLALSLLAQYVAHYWNVAWPQNMSYKKRFALQVLKRFEPGAGNFARQGDTAKRDFLLGDLAKLAQLWQEYNAPDLAQATDNIFALYQRTFRDDLPASVHPADTATVQAVSPDVPPPPAIVPAPTVNIDSHDDKAWRDTLLKVATILCERQPDSPLGYRLRRHALWQNITSLPQAEGDGRTPLAAVPADMMDNYLSRLNNADMALWQQVEKSLLLAPYWFDGHYLSAQTAQRLGYASVAEAIRDEVIHFLARLPLLATLLFNDRTPFVTEQTKQWLAISQSRQTATAVVHTDENTQTARHYFNEQGLEAALRYLDTLPEGDPRDHFHRQYLGAQLMEEAGMIQLAQQQYRMLFRAGLQVTLADWEPSLLEALENNFTAEQ
ncbi:TPA: type VI secretion system protein TssA [Citrobacter gillenii]